ncbi:metallophosphoesterase [uncultured Aureimonas sp.]|uniref:metallophosphoesterase n=1 Tax=uncultured Aureimonas sp. TaxID=1604662 RepID=UPI0025D58118|nr:metallophosphoesterase [uncultured Aureimonas sp.]
MRLLVVSDIHEDHNRNIAGPFDLPTDVEADVVVIAGDIDGRFSRAGLRWLERQRLRIDRPFVIVPGNHCFWRGSLDREVSRFHDRCSDAGIHVLDGDGVVLDGTRFVGGTLWTDYRVWNDEREASANAAPRHMVDFRYVRTQDYEYRLRPAHLAAEHDRHVAAIERILSTPLDGPTVVVTHHAPSPRSLIGGRATEALDGAYASDLEPLILRLRPDLWIHGHTHAQHDYAVGSTRVVCNPRGYAYRVGHGRQARLHFENAAFDPRFVVDVGVAPRPESEARVDVDLLLRDWPAATAWDRMDAMAAEHPDARVDVVGGLLDDEDAPGSGPKP